MRFNRYVAASTSAVFALAIGLSGAAHAQKAPKVQKLSDNVYSVFAVFYNSLVVVGKDGVLITDPANNFRAGLLKAAVAKITRKPVTHIVLTHEHFDHVGGTGVFGGAKIIAQENVGTVFKFDPLGITPKKIDVTFSTNHAVDMGNTKVQLKYLGAGDGVATTIVHLPSEKIVATADLYDEGKLTPGAFLDDKNMLGVRSILNEIAKWDLKHAVNAHSPNTGPDVLRANATYYNDLFDAVFPEVQKTAKTNPKKLFGLPKTMSQSVKMPKYQSWKNYDQLPHHVRRMVLAIMHGG